ncbi:MAG TPA: HAD-IIIA family hydrolase [Nitrospirae bacterium]|nr:HAD-IIIA family hydrolase [Nitrospirota bacterium]
MQFTGRTKNIIFDLDGTLVDTAQDLANALSHAVSPYERGPYGPEEIKPLVGEGLERLIAKSLGPGVLGPGAMEMDVQQALHRFVAFYEAHLTDNTHPYEGVADTLRELKDRGLLLAVLSNKRTSMCRSILEALGLIEFFRVVAGGDAPPEKKPSPLAALYVLEALGAVPAESVMVGDSDIDIQTAEAAGMKSIAVTYGFRPREVLSGADHIVEGFPEILPFFEK